MKTFSNNTIFRKNSDHGFVAIFIVILLPLLLSLLIATISILHYLQLDKKLKYTCLKNQLVAQESSADNLNKLLKLNPKALKLRTARAIAQKIYIAAIASANPKAIAIAFQKLKMIKFQQFLLDSQQKLLINSSKDKLYRSYYQNLNSIKEIFNLHNQSIIHITRFKLHRINGKMAQFAVAPDLPDLAPIYKLDLDFLSKMQMVHSWQYNMQVTPALNQFIHFDIQFRRSCSTTLTQQEGQWRSITVKDKFLLK